MGFKRSIISSLQLWDSVALGMLVLPSESSAFQICRMALGKDYRNAQNETHVCVCVCVDTK